MQALITGASSGIGRDMARYLSLKGYNLVIVARNEEALIKLKSELKTNIEIVVADLGKEENCIELFKKYKDIDFLVNNAGFGIFGEFDETDLNKELNMININIKAVHILTKLYLKEMKQRNSGNILNVASIGGCMPGPLMASYYASKAYIIKLTEGINTELKKDKSIVKISALCPGPVKTNFNNVAGVKFNINSLSSEYVAKYSINKALKGKLIIVPGFIIKCVRFLCKIVPDIIIGRFVYRIQERKNKKEEILC